LAVSEIPYKTSEGKEGAWECVGRPTASKEEGRDIEKEYGASVCIVTATDPTTGEKLILLEKIFRIPVRNYVIEFPAGLQDPGETDPSLTAIREVKEETGYVATVDRVMATHRTSPYNGTGTGKLILMSVDLTTEENQNPQPELESSEDIEAFWAPMKGLPDELERRKAEEGVDITALVLSYAVALDFNL